MTRIAVIYYSSTGYTHRMAQAVEEGARSTGAEVRLRKVRELAPPEAIASRAEWKAHVDASGHIQEATLDDLVWADGVVFGTPTRFGLPSAQLKQFLDSTGPLWAKGQLQDKAMGAFTGAGNVHGGQETTLLALNNVFIHWGAIIVPVGYTDPRVHAAGGNPYGASFTGGPGKGELPPEKLAVARFQGERIARFAGVLATARAKTTTA